MENQKPSKKIKPNNEVSNDESSSLNIPVSTTNDKNQLDPLTKKDLGASTKVQIPTNPKKPLKPPKLEDKPFKEFVCDHLIPGLKTSIQQKGTSVNDIKLIKGTRPVVGGDCWMIFCEMSEQRRFWLCFNKELITSDKTILLAESNSDPSIVESFLIDEKKSTLPLLISRVLQRLNGQKWIGAN